LQRDLQDWEALTASSTSAESDGQTFPLELDIGERLGIRTAELHAALATPSEDPAFAVESTAQSDVLVWVEATRKDAEEMFDALEKHPADTFSDEAAEL